MPATPWGRSARALLSVSRAYQDTENSISRQIDATVPPPRNGRPDYPYGGPTGFTGLPDPAAQLTTPDVPPDYPDPLEPVENVLDWVSRSEIVKQVVTHALGWDPYEPGTGCGRSPVRSPRFCSKPGTTSGSNHRRVAALGSFSAQSWN